MLGKEYQGYSSMNSTYHSEILQKDLVSTLFLTDTCVYTRETIYSRSSSTLD